MPRSAQDIFLGQGAEGATELRPARLSFRELEPRIAFDAAMGVALADLADQQGEHHEAPALDATDAYDAPEPGSLSHIANAAVEPDAARQIVFVDAGVEDAEDLLRNVDAEAEIIWLDPRRDGVEQMAEALHGRSGIGSIHIIAHGSAGSLNLGSATLDLVSMTGEHADDLAAIGAALSADGDLLIYGCDFGAGHDGAQAVQALAALTGADIAASDDATGHDSLGGDWELEIRLGAVEAQIANFGGEDDWRHTLDLTAAGGETLVNAAPGGVQTTALSGGRQVAVDGNGDHVVVWEEGGYIYARKFDSDGTAIGGTLNVNTLFSGDTWEPAVAINDTGDFVIVWTGNSADNGIRAQRFSATGAFLGSEIVVSSYGTGNQYAPSVAMNASGFTIVWTSDGQDGSGTAIVGQRFDLNGAKVGGEFIVNTTTAGNQEQPTLAMNNDGDTVVVWTSPDADGTGVFARAYNAAGAAISGEIQVNTTTTGWQELPSVAILPSGDFVVTWTGEGDGSVSGIYARRFDATGAALGGEFPVNTYTLGEQAPSNVAVLPDGGFVIQWSSDGQDGGSYGQYLKTYGPNGVAITGDVRVNTTTAGGQIWGDIAVGGNRVVSIWSGNGAGDADGVFLQRYSTNSAPSGIEARPGVTASELLADYEFDAANDLGRDDSGDGNHLTLFGAPTQTTGPSGDGALYLTGGDYAVLPAITTGGAMTFAASVRFDSTGNYQRVFDFGQAFSGGIGNIYVSRVGTSSDLTFTLETNPGTPIRAIAAGAITNGAWLHFVATVDGAGAMSLYVNGVLADVEAGYVPAIGVRDNLYIGRSHWGDPFFDGAIDNFFAAEGAVTAAQALAIYNQTTGFSVAENSANGTVLGTAVGADPDAGGSLTYSLTDNAGGRFAIDAATGEITVANGLLLNFEASPTHTIIVQAQDAGGLSTTQAFTVTLTDVNDAPTGVPAIAGIVAEDQTLTADTSGIADDDGLGAFSHQWFRNGVAIAGATASTYTLGDADVGAAITVGVSYTDGGGNAAGPLVSAATAAVSGVNDAPVNTLPGTQTTAINTPLVLSTATGTAITVADIDASSVQVTLTAANGTLRLATVAGLAFSIGDGVDDATMTFSGSVAAINTALNGLRFDPSTGFQGNATIQIVTNDLGATGAGGALSDTDVLSVQVGAVRFQQGVNGYSGTLDTFTDSLSPNANNGALAYVQVDDSFPEQSGLLRFDNLFGTGPGQIPPGSTINSASLSFYVLTSNFLDQLSFLDSVTVHRMLAAWSEASTHNTLTGGIQLDNIEAGSATLAAFDAGFGGWKSVTGLASIVQNWANGGANNGFAFRSALANTWQFASSENPTVSLRPYLTIDFTPPQGSTVTPVGSSTFTEGGPAVAVNPGLTLTDPDSTVMTGATIRITNYIPGQDSLQFTNQSGITGSWDNVTGTLTLSGSASIASYQTALRSIAYSNASDTPDPAARLIEITVDDQYATGSTATATVNITPTNDAPTGLPLITGTATEDQMLGVNTAAIADADGLGAFSYQWLRNGVAIAGANASTYTLGDADVGAAISVRVAWTDGYGTAESVTSAATAAIANVNDTPAGAPVVTGTATENQTLGVNTAGIADNDGLGAFSYQWLRNGVAIGGATASTYTLGNADVGQAISVRVSYTDGHGTAEAVTSAATAPVSNVNDAPTGLPLVTGTATEDQTLGVNTAGIADADGLGAFSYQWLRNGVAISGATASTYTLGDADVGRAISIRVSWTDGNGTAEAVVSAATAPVANVNDAPAAIDDFFSVAEDSVATLINLLGNDTDIDGDVLSVSTLAGVAVTPGVPQTIAVANGALEVAADGSIRFTPATNYSGPVVFSYTVSDGQGGTDAGQMTITVNAVNDTVGAVIPTPQTVAEDNALVFSTANGNAIVLTDPDGTLGSDAIVRLSIPAGAGTLTLGGVAGLLTVAGNGSNEITMLGSVDAMNLALQGLTFVPTADWNGSFNLSVNVTRPSNVGFLNSGFEDPDFADADTFRYVDQAFIPGWQTTATDNWIEVWDSGHQGVDAFDGDQFVELNAEQVSTLFQTFTPSYAGGDLTLTFAHRGRAGIDTMNVTAIDLGGDGVLGGGDDVILFNQDYSTGNTAWAQYGAALGAATGNPILLRFDSISAAGGDQRVGNFLDAIDIFDSSLSASANISVTVTPVADGVADTVATAEDTPVSFNVLTGTNGASADSFENPARFVVSVTQPANGAVAFAADGTLTYTPDPDFNGTDTFTYTVESPAGVTETIVVTMNVSAVNDAPTGLPAIVGTVTEDQTLTANTAGIGDIDGLGAFSYQWFRDGVAIVGATASSYTLGDADVGASITVAVSYVDADGTAEGPLVSAATAPVANVNDAPTGLPVIVGSVTEDQTLAADLSGIADIDGLGAFSYQWLRNGIAIAGATGPAYTLGDADVGAAISVRVSWTDSYGTPETLTSAATAPVVNVNDAPTGIPVIVGVATENQTLAADATGIADDDGLGAFSYQWLRNGVAIAGATASSYTLGDADVGATITVAVSYIDADGTAEGPLVSAPTAAVANVNDAPTGLPSIVGIVQEDQTLSVNTAAIADNDGLGAFSYQWLRNGVAIAGATASSYTLGDADVGAAITLRVRYTDGWGTAETLLSAATVPVVNVNDAPTGLPVIVGAVTEDQTLSADVSGIADNDGLGAFSWQWFRNGVAIAGATASSYTLGDADVGTAITVRASWTDGNGTAETLVSAATAPVANVNDAPTGIPVITGVVTENQTLTADTSGIGDNDGLGAFSYQWFRNGVAIAGATGSTYTLGDADVSATITVAVTYTDGWGTAEGPLVSAATAPVANVNDAPTGLPVIVGTVTEDQTLAADVSGIADNDGLGAFSYQWLRNGVAIAGATASSYTLGDADVGTAIRVRVSWTDGWGTAESVTSAATAPVANVNDVPAGVPAIVGAAVEDQTLTADVSGISDDDGLGAFAYQWMRNGVAIAGATASTYTLGDADVGTVITVAVTYTDFWGTAEGPLVSAATAAVANVNDAPAGLPAIVGIVTEDQTLTADVSGISDNDGLGALSYQWYRDGVAIPGATAASYTLGDDDVSARITVSVAWTDGWGTAETVTSVQSVPVVNVNDVPTGSPVIVGDPTEDQTLTADISGIADNDGLGVFAYQWFRDGVAIAGATAQSYTLGDADVGAAITVAITYTDRWGTAEGPLVSAPTAPVVNVNDVPRNLPAILGVATEDETLTVDVSALEDDDGLGAFSYQWLRNGVAIAGATGASYTLGDDDVAATISVAVSWTDGWGTAEEVVSDPTTPIVNVNDFPVIISDGGGPVATISAPENSSLATSIQTFDVDGGAPAFSIIGGADASRFTLNASSGELRFVVPPNFEGADDANRDSVYEIDIRVDDGFGGFATQSLVIVVTDVQGEGGGDGDDASGDDDDDPRKPPEEDERPRVTDPGVEDDSVATLLEASFKASRSDDGGRKQQGENDLDAPGAPASLGGDAANLFGLTDLDLETLTPPEEAKPAPAADEVSLDLRQLSQSDLWKSFDQLANDVLEDDRLLGLEFRELTLGGGVALTAGIVAWALRGGVVASSLLLALPALHRFDPILVVVARKKAAEAQAAEDAVENLFESARPAAQSRN